MTKHTTDGTTTGTDIRGWVGRTLVSTSGEKIGKIDEIYMDEETGKPEWLAVHTGLFGTSTSFVPLAGAVRNGDDLQVTYTKDQVKDAPRAEADGLLSQDEEARLYRHYGLEYGESRSDSGLPEGRATGTAQTGTGDNAMTRSEEELTVAKRTREAGTARLRKWVETEHVETTVPVAREEVRIEREPITDANRAQALSGAEISEGVHEVTLHEEEAVANTRVQPKERIRLETDTVVENETVSADLRKEHVEVEGDAASTTGRRS